MTLKESNRAYAAPLAKVVEIKAKSIICTSAGTESYSLSSSRYDDNDWE